MATTGKKIDKYRQSTVNLLICITWVFTSKYHSFSNQNLSSFTQWNGANRFVGIRKHHARVIAFAPSSSPALLNARSSDIKSAKKCWGQRYVLSYNESISPPQASEKARDRRSVVTKAQVQKFGNCTSLWDQFKFLFTEKKHIVPEFTRLSPA